MQTISTENNVALTLLDIDVLAGATARSNVYANGENTTGCSVELRVTLLGAGPVNLAVRILGQNSAPAADPTRLLPIDVKVPDTSALGVNYAALFVVPIFTPVSQIEVQNVSGGNVHVFASVQGNLASFVSSPAAAGSVGSVQLVAGTADAGTVHLGAGTAAIGHVVVDTLPALSASSAVIGHVVVDTMPPLAAGANAIGSVAVTALPALVASAAVIGHVINDASTAVIGHVIVDSQLAALPAGANAIGTVGVTALPALVASTAVIGHVIVDSQVAALPAGTNVIGHVIVDSQVAALPAGANAIGTVGVTALPALPAGTNVIGHVIVDASSAVIGHVVVDTLPTIALGTSANAIGKLAANATVNIGTVDVATLPALPAGTNSIGAVTVALPTTPYHGSVTVAAAGTRVQLATTQALKEGVDIEAHPGNNGLIYVGGVTVTAANGRRLSGGQSLFVRIADLATMYIDASISGEGATYLGA